MSWRPGREHFIAALPWNHPFDQGEFLPPWTPDQPCADWMRAISHDSQRRNHIYSGPECWRLAENNESNDGETQPDWRKKCQSGIDYSLFVRVMSA